MPCFSGCGAFSTQSSDGIAKNGQLGLGRAHRACAHISDTQQEYLSVVWCARTVKVERVSAFFSCFDVDVNGCRVCVRVRAGVLCGNEGPVGQFELYAFGFEPMFALARKQVFGHARHHGESR
jgi:hypothetical protein